jgi:hypothetical protein
MDEYRQQLLLEEGQSRAQAAPATAAKVSWATGKTCVAAQLLRVTCASICVQ